MRSPFDALAVVVCGDFLAQNLQVYRRDNTLDLSEFHTVLLDNMPAKLPQLMAAISQDLIANSENL